MAYIGRSVDVGMFEKQVLTPDSVTTTFALTFAVGSANSLFVVYGGVAQEPGVAYSVSGGGQQIVFSEAPATGTTLYIIYYGKQLTTPRAAGQETTKQTFAGDGSTVTFTLTDPPVVPAGIMVFVDGILQREGSGNNYVSSGSTISFTSAPDSSAEIDVYTLVKEKVSIDTVADGSITRAKLAQSAPYWDGAGNVGINVAAPAGVLDMQKDQDAQTLVYLRNASTGTSARTRMIFSGDASAGNLSIGMYNSTNSSAPNQAWVWASGASSPLILGTVGTERVRITTSGDVGIGTSSPSQKLDVSGNINVSGTGTSNFTSTATSPVQINGTSIPTLTVRNSTTPVETQIRSTTTEGLIRTATDHPLVFGTNAVERMRIDDSGNVCIGSTTPGNAGTVNVSVGLAGTTAGGLQLWASTSQTHVIQWGDGTTGTDQFRGYIEYAHNGDSMRFGTQATERMRITSGGILLLGTTSDPQGSYKFRISGTDTVVPGIVFNNTTNTKDYSIYSVGTSFAIRDNTAGENRITLDTSGNVLVGTTSQIVDEKFGVLNAANTALGVFRSSIGSYTNVGLQVRIVDGSTSGSKYYAIATYAGSTPAYRFIVADSGTVTNATGTYGTISDVKLKENIVDASPKLADIMRLQVRNFNLKSNPSEKHIGFIAQEMETVFPAMVESHPDRDADGNTTDTITKTVKTSILVPILVKAIQELKAIVDAQAVEIAALKAK